MEGTLAWRDGTLEGLGTTVIEAGGRALVGGDEFDFAALRENRVLVNRGDVVVATGAQLSQSDGSSILNAGTLELQGTGAIEGDGFFGFGVATLLHNTGLVKKTGAGVAEADTAIDNDGTLEVLGGTLTARGLLNYSFEDDSLTGGSYVMRNAALHVRGPVETSAARIVLDGASAQLRASSFTGGAESDALAGLQRNAAAGTLALSGGRSLTVGAFVNQGVLELGPGSTFGYGRLPPDRRRRPAAVGHGGRSFGPRRGRGRRPARRPDRHPAGARARRRSPRPLLAGRERRVRRRDGLPTTVVPTATEVRLRPPGVAPRTRRRRPPPAAGSATSPEPAAAPADAARRRRTVGAPARRARGDAPRCRGSRCRPCAGASSRCSPVRAAAAAPSGSAGPVARGPCRCAGRPGRRTIRVFALRRARAGTVRLTTTSSRRVAIRALLVRR